eukprot:TRINITY_DN16195_c0_g1_i1.p1 TRINITY_DN16195_c0_g1~~TRINITY_DN16195_c0_g1_i1.p1  ORF type:complete len:573 (-),score=86.15 TRINITY_DN16195_c0_g1_i1:134-1852(-)
MSNLMSALELSAISCCLDPFGYEVADSKSWRSLPHQSRAKPVLELGMSGHGERDNHTFYDIRCRLAVCCTDTVPEQHLDWVVQRRLVQLREELHSCVKHELGKSYAQLFAKAPFAKRGGFSGTTERLQVWLETLAMCINEGSASPTLVARVFNFLEIQAQERRQPNFGVAVSPSKVSHSDDHESPVAMERCSPPVSGASKGDIADATTELDQEETAAEVADCAEEKCVSGSEDEPGPARAFSFTMDHCDSADVPDVADVVDDGPDVVDAKCSGARSVDTEQSSPAKREMASVRSPDDMSPSEARAASGMVESYLAPYGFDVACAERWRTTPAWSRGRPRLRLSIVGHEERGSHTYYKVRCIFSAEIPDLKLEWSAQRRLAQLRDGLHDITKNELGKHYVRIFEKAPFAKRGGLSGTTGRLQKWLETLASCVNEGTAAPALVAQIFLFLDAPPQIEHHTSAVASSLSEAKTLETPSMSSTPIAGSTAVRRSLTRGSSDRGASSGEEVVGEFTTDEENFSSWSPEKRRAGYTKLREWFSELRRRLERKMQRESSPSRSPRPEARLAANSANLGA